MKFDVVNRRNRSNRSAPMTAGALVLGVASGGPYATFANFFVSCQVLLSLTRGKKVCTSEFFEGQNSFAMGSLLGFCDELL